MEQLAFSEGHWNEQMVIEPWDVIMQILYTTGVLRNTQTYF